MLPCAAKGAGNTSCKIGVVAPMSTILPFITSGGTSPFNSPEYFPLASFAEAFTTRRNVIALEGHNSSNDSTDMSLDPSLVVESGE
jgi:hypothetical protein